MAYATVTYLAANVVGHSKEDYIGFVATATSHEVKTRLHWIEEVHVQTASWPGSATNSTGDQAMNIYLNATSTTEGADPGILHIEALTGTEPVILRVVGK